MPNVNERLAQQLEFLKAVDKLKLVDRKTSILDGSRKENSAEHSWHVMLTVMTLAEHANSPIDTFKVMKLFAVHELGEISSGDTFHYHKSAQSDHAERLAVQKLFSILPSDQAQEFITLWDEFEEGKTTEARFAQAVDRIWPIFQNVENKGGTWAEFNLSYDTVMSRNLHIKDGSKELWECVSGLIDKAKESGYLSP